ncbi:M28 family metallopeptidase [Flavobacteriaceae bacterium]|jgi:Zn-dependent M28 family amino/carboxypeptidase|uniref:M28 family metallopeptidase n=1 Tax=Candidatus Arcticimaribacter forsetii TaxID=2820661 RepID=UPI002077773E|nr:M28 family metallopeptidase [Candidatus Arcticimaribacter forsetii]MCH1538653.1 M28 family metallopeptidase [Flavobacteriaceae bacterium]MDB2326226.1 M28 family metallopeptidase [Flavobacteriaceae bacterium]MDB2330045.1 M28 family metallopeptidase [Flavobacteriaceae bacterium]MDB2345998.1 M28 family metallopeptidase [Flavobacteriaceae bacterium]MDB4643173.1 M28 family metallopeptidase [Flavobacteriaceae bacterium]
MKSLYLLTFLFCASLTFAQNTESDAYSTSIEAEDLRQLLYVYASDFFQGRETGALGQKRAVTFLKEFYQARGIKAGEGSEDYFQKMTLNIKDKEVQTENVIAIIEGSEKPEEYLVISSHLDHIGIHDGEINNGADDDGSGTVSLLEIAEAFQLAVEAGKGPKRSIIFLHVTGEEKGLLGSKYYTDNPLYPLENTIANLNIDMVGRTDPKRVNDNPNYIYLIGSDRLSMELHEISEEVNKATVNIDLDYTYNAHDDKNRFYFRSDHYNFAKNNIPVIFYFNGTHADYHRPTDTVEKIEYDLMETRARLIFATAWELANREERIKLIEQ